MTLREYLDQKPYQTYYWLWYVCCIIFGAFPTIYLLGSSFGSLPAMLGGVGLMLAFILGQRLFRLIRCPRCSARLGELAYMCAMSKIRRRVGPDRATAARQVERLGSCPSCGLRLDEETGKP